MCHGSPARYHSWYVFSGESFVAVNQSPLYQEAEERYRSASTSAEKIAALEEMLRLVPKHKASEKLQSQIKQKLKTAREEQQKPSAKRGQASHDPFFVPKQGAGQVVLLGEANVGKSSIVAALTHAKVEVAEFPFSTHAAVPGIAHHEDVPIQLVDMPPLMPGHAQPGMLSAYRSADMILHVVDVGAIDLIDQHQRPSAWLAEHNVLPGPSASVDLTTDEAAGRPTPTLLGVNKMDLPGANDNLACFLELSGGGLRAVPISAKAGTGLTEMVAECFRLLNVIRVYAKKPGKPVDREAPFILPIGATVHDMAYLVHREMAKQLKSARIWGAAVHDGQQVHATQVLTDKNVVELHFQ